MRVLIVAAALLACAVAAPSGLGAAHIAAYAAPLAVGIAPALPTISSGDVQAAAINAHVDAADHTRAAYDATRQLQDQAIEYQGRAINAAKENGWRAIDTVKTVEAQLDGAAAGAAPTLAKSLVSPAVIAAAAAYAAPAVYAAPATFAAPAAYTAPAALAAPAIYAAPASKTVVTQSLSQTHLAPARVVYTAAAPVAYSAPAAYTAYAAPAAYAATPYLKSYAQAW